MRSTVAGMCPRTAAKLALAAVPLAVALFGGSSEASAQILPQPGAADYCADASPNGAFTARLPRAYITIADPGASGRVSARMWGTQAECILTRPATCPSNCRLQVQTVCEFHCDHNHTAPYAWTVELVGTPSGGWFLQGWSGNCQPIASARQSSCVVRMTSNQSVAARFGRVADTTPPSAPVVSATRGRYDVTLSWPRSVDNFWLGGYDIFKNDVRTARVGAGTTSFKVTNLLCHTTYRFRVEAFDTQRSASSSEITVTTGSCAVAAAPRPNTVIHVARVRRHTAYFHWGYRGTVRATKYQCKLDRRRWRRCRPGKTYRDLRRGWHRFAVRAGNANGWDRTPATRRFRIR